MVKHILGQAIWQCILLLIVIFAGHTFIKEQWCNYTWSDSAPVRAANYKASCGSLDEILTKRMVLAALAPGQENESPDYRNELMMLWNTKAKLDSKEGYVLNGMMKSIGGMPVYEPFNKITNSRHLSVVFNLFVFCQIFNMICARKINDEINVFQHVMGNMTFIAVWLVIVVVQCLVT